MYNLNDIWVKQIHIVKYLYFFFSNVLVYRVGGTSLDATILNVTSGIYRVVASRTLRDLGGSHIDQLIVEYFATEFKKLVFMILQLQS